MRDASVATNLKCGGCGRPLVKDGYLKCRRCKQLVEATLRQKMIFCPNCKKPRILLARYNQALCQDRRCPNYKQKIGTPMVPKDQGGGKMNTETVQISFKDLVDQEMEKLRKQIDDILRKEPKNKKETMEKEIALKYKIPRLKKELERLGQVKCLNFDVSKISQAIGIEPTKTDTQETTWVIDYPKREGWLELTIKPWELSAVITIHKVPWGAPKGRIKLSNLSNFYLPMEYQHGDMCPIGWSDHLKIKQGDGRITLVCGYPTLPHSDEVLEIAKCGIHRWEKKEDQFAIEKDICLPEGILCDCKW